MMGLSREGKWEMAKTREEQDKQIAAIIALGEWLYGDEVNAFLKAVEEREGE